MLINTAAKPSRRKFMASLAHSLLISSSGVTVANSVEAELSDLGCRFASLASRVDFAIAHKLDLPWKLLTQLDHIQQKILEQEAKTTAGLFAKAQTVCWGRLGDLDSSSDMKFSEKMTLSIIRDLIRLHNPSLEHPGALAALIQGVEI